MTYINVAFLYGARGNHGGHAVAPQTVSQYRGHHRVAVGNVLTALVGQRDDHLQG